MFSQRPDHHLSGSGCPHCKAEKLKQIKLSTTDEFIEKSSKIHGGRYDYSAVMYIDAKTPVIINCVKHGSFEQLPTNHLSGSGCPHCGAEMNKARMTLTTKEFIEKAKNIHKDCYRYDDTFYVNSKTDVLITCEKHGLFKQRPHNHLEGKGCPRCYKHSQKEKIIYDILLQQNIHVETEKTFDVLRNFETGKLYRFDFFLSEYNVILEYDGQHHFRSIKKFGGDEYLKRVQESDKIKNKFCMDMGITLYRINYRQNLRRAVMSVIGQLPHVVNHIPEQQTSDVPSVDINIL